MTTPGGVPNLPKGALTVGTLGSSLQDHTPEALRARANERVPTIFDNSTGGNILNDLSPFGIITGIWSAVNSLIAGADPADIQGPEDIPELLIDFIEGLPFVGQFVTLLTDLLAALQGEYEGTDEILLAIQSFLAPLIAFLKHVFDGFLAGFLSTGSTFLKAVFDWLGFFWGLFGEAVEGVLNPILEFIKWAWEKLDEIVGGTADQILRAIVDGIMWVWVNIGEPVVKAIGGVIEWIVGVIDIDLLKSILEKIAAALGSLMSPAGFGDLLTTVMQWFATLFGGIINSGSVTLGKLLEQIPFVDTIVAVITGKSSGSGLGALSEWARSVEKTAGDALSVVGDIAKRVLGLVPVSQINFAEPNLLSQGDFKDLATVDGANGWEWDGSITATGSGGCVMHTSTGAESYLYSKQSIRVAGGDKLVLSGKVRTTGFTSGTMELALIPWVGTTRYSSTAYRRTMATRTTASTGSWASLTSTSWTVPDGVTTVQVVLRCQVNAGATVRFDDIYLRKVGALGQQLVDNLINAWRSIVTGIMGVGEDVSNVFWDAVGGFVQFLTGTANGAADDIGQTNITLFGDPAGGTQVGVDALPTGALAEALGTSGSGARMVRTDEATKWGTNAGGHGGFGFGFYESATGSTDISKDVYNGRFTVTHAGWYLVEVGFTTNATPGNSGAFAVAPAVDVGGQLHKIGASAIGSYGFGFGAYARSAQSSFIVYLTAGQSVGAGYYNFGTTAVANFFQGNSNGLLTYFSIAMLNRTQEG